MREGVAGLTREKRANPGKPPLPVATVQLVVDFALGPPPVSRGTGSRRRPISAMAAAVHGIFCS